MPKKQPSEEITITVINWEKHNARTDVKKNWWFKLSNEFFEDTKIRKCTQSEALTYLWALTECSKNPARDPRETRDTFTRDLRHASHTSLHRNKASFLRALNALARYGLVALDKRRGEERRGEYTREEKNVCVDEAEIIKTKNPYSYLKISPELSSRLVEAWRETLLAKGKIDDPRLDDHTLVRAYLMPRRGDRVFDAIRGLANEPNTKDFDATANCYASRLIGKDSSFDRLVSLGSKPKFAAWEIEIMEKEKRDKENMANGVS